MTYLRPRQHNIIISLIHVTVRLLYIGIFYHSFQCCSRYYLPWMNKSYLLQDTDAKRDGDTRTLTQFHAKRFGKSWQLYLSYSAERYQDDLEEKKRVSAKKAPNTTMLYTCFSVLYRKHVYDRHFLSNSVIFIYLNRTWHMAKYKTKKTPKKRIVYKGPTHIHTPNYVNKIWTIKHNDIMYIIRKMFSHFFHFENLIQCIIV